MGLFGTAHGWGGEQKVPTLKPVTHHTMMKFGTVLPYHKKLYIYIYMNHVTHPLRSADINIFSLEIS